MLFLHIHAYVLKAELHVYWSSRQFHHDQDRWARALRRCNSCEPCHVKANTAINQVLSRGSSLVQDRYTQPREIIQRLRHTLATSLDCSVTQNINQSHKDNLSHFPQLSEKRIAYYCSFRPSWHHYMAARLQTHVPTTICMCVHLHDVIIDREYVWLW